MPTDHKNRIQILCDYGQSVWLDYISRQLITSGKLKQMIEDDDLRGVTSNPTIFQEAISKSSDYDDQIHKLVEQGKSVFDIFEAVTTTDVRMGLDVFHDTYEKTSHVDGRVSIEVTPDLAFDTRKTIDQAKRFWKLVDRPNLFVKIPATKEGLPAIEECISEGININITLLFALERYDEVMEAYLRGLEHRVDQGLPIHDIFSVASFFVSRVDTMVDAMLQKRIDATDNPDQKRKLQSLQGKAAIANAKIAYQHFQKVFQSDRFRRLQDKGANLQRPLWASTSTKNPAYRDVIYVEELIGPHTVNTMPEHTLEAFKDHGQVRGQVVLEDVEGAQRTLDELAQAGIDMRDVTLVKLVDEGVKKFADSYNKLMDSIREKREVIAQHAVQA